jgi:hypothetical protein
MEVKILVILIHKPNCCSINSPLFQVGGWVWCANVGDSRALLCRNGPDAFWVDDLGNPKPAISGRIGVSYWVYHMNVVG